jgi:4-amino-4-deoxy-L-arabinose transferase-like glycosyltransferase
VRMIAQCGNGGFVAGRLRRTVRAGSGGLFPVGMLSILLLASVLRFWSIDFGLPLITHPDEPLIFHAAERMIAERSLNPGWFRYPAFIINVQAGILASVYLIDRLVGLSQEEIWTAGYTSGRVVMATLGVLTVGLTGVLARRIARSALRGVSQGLDDGARSMLADVAGLSAAGLLAVSFIHVKDSHFLKPDVPTAFFASLTLLLTLRAWQQSGGPTLRAWVLPGIAVGLAAASKYTGAVVAIVPAVALLLALLRVERGGLPVAATSFARVSAGMAAASVAAFLAVNPYVALAPREFLSPVDGIRAEIQHYRTGHDGAEGSDTWRWYLGETWRNGFGPTLTPVVILGSLGALWSLARRWRPRQPASRGLDPLIPCLLFLPLYYATIAPYPVRFDRQLIPALPYLAILGGVGLALGLRMLVPLVGSRPTTITASVVLVLIAVLALPPALDGTRWGMQAGKRDSRYDALDWVRAHVEPGTTIAREWHTPPLAQAGYGDIFIRKANDHPLEWYDAVGARYLILSSFMYQRYLDAPEQYPDDAAFYARLLSQPRQATFSAANGPVVIILRVEDIAPAFASHRALPAAAVDDHAWHRSWRGGHASAGGWVACCATLGEHRGG